jgi:hypothetical protein
VTCQPFVEWRNGVTRHGPVNKGSVQTRWCHATTLEYGSCATVPRSHDDVTCVYVVDRRRAAILPDCRGSERRDVTVLLNNAMTVAGRPLTQLGYISEAICRFSLVPGVTVKKSVFRKQLYDGVVRSNPTNQLLSSNLKKWIRGVRSRREFRSVKWRLCVRDSVW